MSASTNRLERRGGRRFEAHLPLAVHHEGRTMRGYTQDLSGRGMFFFADANLPQGAVVEVTFAMPSEITLGEIMPVRGRGRVLRASSSQAGQRSGIAVKLDAYEYLAADAPVSQFVRVSGGASEAFSAALTR